MPRPPRILAGKDPLRLAEARARATADLIADDGIELSRLLAAGTVARMQAQLAGHPAGATGPGGRSVLWCWVHEREVLACHTAGDACDGEAIPVNDPTGEAGIRPDPVAADLLTVGKLLERSRSDLDRLVRILVRHVARPPTSLQRWRVEEQNAPVCELCAEIDHISEARSTKGTDVGGILDHPRRLCRWCEDFIRTQRKVPSISQRRAHAAGKRVYVPPPTLVRVAAGGEP